MFVVTSALLALTIIVVLVLAVLLVATICLSARAIKLYRRTGSFECYWVTNNMKTCNWGVACYNQHELTWYRVVSYNTYPELRWKRNSIEFSTDNVNIDHEANKACITFTYGEFVFTLCMSVLDYEGFVSWIESAPPQCNEFY